MTMPDLWTLPSAPTIDLLGWTLLHVVWQGALLVAVLAGALYLLQTHSPRVRYAVNCAALLGLFALPVGTGLALARAGERVGAAGPAVARAGVGRGRPPLCRPSRPPPTLDREDSGASHARYWDRQYTAVGDRASTIAFSPGRSTYSLGPTSSVRGFQS
jgi:hypothetical protein